MILLNGCNSKQEGVQAVVSEGEQKLTAADFIKSQSQVCNPKGYEETDDEALVGLYVAMDDYTDVDFCYSTTTDGFRQSGTEETYRHMISLILNTDNITPPAVSIDEDEEQMTLYFNESIKKIDDKLSGQIFTNAIVHTIFSDSDQFKSVVFKINGDEYATLDYLPLNEPLLYKKFAFGDDY